MSRAVCCPICNTPERVRFRWRVAWCISYYESRHLLGARNGANLGPWQINVAAHPWASPYLLTHSWRYSARVAYRISNGGRD